MYTVVIGNDLRLWIEVAKSTLHSGNKVGSARLHALQMMIDETADNALYWEDKHRPTLMSVSKLCQFAKKEHVTANEKNIFIHIIIDMLETQFKNLPKEEPPRRLINWDEPEPSQDGFEEPYRTEDSPDYLIPPTDLDDFSDEELPDWLR